MYLTLAKVGHVAKRRFKRWRHRPHLLMGGDAKPPCKKGTYQKGGIQATFAKHQSHHPSSCSGQKIWSLCSLSVMFQVQTISKSGCHYPWHMFWIRSPLLPSAPFPPWSKKASTLSWSPLFPFDPYCLAFLTRFRDALPLKNENYTIKDVCFYVSGSSLILSFLHPFLSFLELHFFLWEVCSME